MSLQIASHDWVARKGIFLPIICLFCMFQRGFSKADPDCVADHTCWGPDKKFTF